METVAVHLDAAFDIVRSLGFEVEIGVEARIERDADSLIDIRSTEGARRTRKHRKVPTQLLLKTDMKGVICFVALQRQMLHVEDGRARRRRIERVPGIETRVLYPPAIGELAAWKQIARLLPISCQ